MSKGMTAQEIAEKQVRRAKGAVQDFKDGVAAVTTSPTAQAAKAVDRWFAGVQQAMEDGSYVDGCNAVSLAEWQQRTIDKGGLNYASGVSAAADTIAEFHSQREAFQKSIDSKLATMPRGDLQQNIQRMLTQVTMQSGFKFKKRRK